MLSRLGATPLGQAIWSMLGLCVFAVLLRFTWGFVDPEMRGWSVLLAAPVLGVLTYLHAIGRHSAVATFLIAIGAAGLAFWTGIVASGRMPVARADVPWVALIFAFPLVSLGIGLYKRQQLQRQAAARKV